MAGQLLIINDFGSTTMLSSFVCFSYIDQGKNPNLYTKDCLEKALSKNEQVKGKIDNLKVLVYGLIYMSHDVRKPAFCICENKDADQLRGNREADQRLCFRYMDSTIPLLSKSDISSL